MIVITMMSRRLPRNLAARVIVSSKIVFQAFLRSVSTSSTHRYGRLLPVPVRIGLLASRLAATCGMLPSPKHKVPTLDELKAHPRSWDDKLKADCPDAKAHKAKKHCATVRRALRASGSHRLSPSTRACQTITAEDSEYSTRTAMVLARILYRTCYI